MDKDSIVEKGMKKTQEEQENHFNREKLVESIKKTDENFSKWPKQTT